MNPISVQVLRGSDGLVNVIKVSKTGRQCVVKYDSVRNFTVSGSMPKHIAQVLAINAAYSPTPMDIVAQTIGSIDIDIAAQTVGNLTVDIAAASIAGNLNVNIAAQAADVNVNLNAQAADIDCNITNATLTIAGNVNATVTGSVTVTSGAVTVSTAGGINLILDKLTQSAYTANSVNIANDNGVATPTAPPSNRTAATYYGKYFPRGCRGGLYAIGIYCKRTAAGTLTLSYAPSPCMGATGSVTITPGADWNWSYGIIEGFWNYDSMFLWVSACSADVSWGYDAGSPADLLSSGATWTPKDERLFIRVLVRYGSVGDVPVSGTVNNIPIPNSVSVRTKTSWTIPHNSESLDDLQIGSGKLLICFFHGIQADSENMLYPRIYCDGISVLPFDMALSAWNQTVTSSSEGIYIGIWDAGANNFNVVVVVPYPFKRSLQIGYYNAHPANDYSAEVGYNYEKIS